MIEVRAALIHHRDDLVAKQGDGPMALAAFFVVAHCSQV